MLSKLLFACLLGACAAFVPTTKLPGSRVARAAVSAPPQMGIGGVNGALDFGNLASGVGGEGTGIALGANEPALLAILLAIPFIIGTLFNGWQGYQDDDDDFFDTCAAPAPSPAASPPLAPAARAQFLRAPAAAGAAPASRPRAAVLLPSWRAGDAGAPRPRAPELPPRRCPGPRPPRAPR